MWIGMRVRVVGMIFELDMLLYPFLDVAGHIVHYLYCKA
jgi:hypothetical protein